jgi:hypothetical protein
MKTSLQYPSPDTISPARHAVTAERFRRLVRLVQLLGEEPRTREQLLAQLELDIRGFYRDLELLRSMRVTITLSKGLYHLVGSLDEVLPRLPYPDPHLTLGEMRRLARGRSHLHETLQGQIEGLLA